jgi:alkaline phosphatase
LRPGPDCDDRDARALACARNVILFVGDGMGFQQVRAGRCFDNGNTAPLTFETLPYAAQMTTASASSSVTDSAASATAMATGRKVNNGVVSIALPGDGVDLQTVLELRKARGQSTGLVTIFNSVADATPAGFGAHTSSRYDKSEIASDFRTGSRPNVLFGKADSAVLASQFTAAGYTYVTDPAAVDGSSLASVLGVFGDTAVSLPARTTAALDVLEEDADGFFLMVEQANTDVEGHLNHLEPVVRAVVELEAAVEAALAWAAGRDDTLIVVLADHETGGLTCTIGDYVATTAGLVPSSCSFTSTQHTGVNVPVFALGPGAEDVNGTIDNTDVYSLLAGFGIAR